MCVVRTHTVRPLNLIVARRDTGMAGSDAKSCRMDRKKVKEKICVWHKNTSV